MNISLTPALEKAVKAKVDAGLYNNTSEGSPVAIDATAFINTLRHHDLCRRILFPEEIR